jgi:hypothetical protein
MPVLEIDGEQFDLDQSDAGRLIERDRLGGSELRLDLHEATAAPGSPVVVVDPDPELRQRLFDAVVAVASSGEATYPSVLVRILDKLRASGVTVQDDPPAA